MKKKKTYLGSILLLLLSATVGWAQNQWFKLTEFDTANSMAWMSSGWNGYVYGITGDYQFYYLPPGETTWQPFVNPPGVTSFGSVQATSASSRVFAITPGAVSFTDNLGATWTHKMLSPNGSQTGNGTMIMTYGVSDTRVMAATMHALIGDPHNQIHYSTNSGGNFSSLGYVNFHPAGIHFTTGTTVFSNSTTGLYRTQSLSPMNWEAIAFSGLYVKDLALTETGMYAVVEDASEVSTLHFSADQGETWQLIDGLPETTSILQIGYDSETNQLIVTTDQGVWSYVAGQWNLLNFEQKGHVLAVSNSGKAYVGGVRVPGVQKVNLATATTTAVKDGMLLYPDVMEVTGTDQIYTSASTHAFVSRYDWTSDTWTSHDLFPHIDATRVVSMDRKPDGEIVIGGLGYLARTINGYIAQFADENSAPLAPNYNALFPNVLNVGNNGSVAMVQHPSQNYVDYSTDWGISWNVLYTDEEAGQYDFFRISKVLTGTQTHYIFGMSSSSFINQLVRKPITGGSWTYVLLPNAWVMDVFMDHADQLYATTQVGIYRYYPAQQGWELVPIPVGSDESNRVIELAFDAQNRLYVLNRSLMTAYAEEGLYGPSTDGTGYWHAPFPVINGETVRLQSLRLSSSAVPFAFSERGTSRELAGIYVYNHSPELGQNDSQERPAVWYPNPTNNHLYFSGDSSTASGIIVYDLTGKVVHKLSQSEQLELHALPVGIYLMQWKSNGKTYTQRIVRN